MRTDILRVCDLQVAYDTPLGVVHAVQHVSFALQAGERFGLVGESGSGKSTIALSLLRLLKPPGRIVGGAVWLDDINLLTLSTAALPALRLAGIALIPQSSMHALNPVLRIKQQIADALRDHGVRLSRQQLNERVRDLLQQVGLQPEVAEMFPHELSGGMKQRVCIAIAISLRPRVIIADEPTSALDVVVQKQVMETLVRVQQDLGAAVLLIGHDMGLMAQCVDRLGVMYAGQLVELAPVRDIFTQPLHPYTRMLIASLPSLDRKGPLRGIPGLPPSLLERSPGCVFQPRCPQAVARCQTEAPDWRERQPQVWAACHL
jgi:peptide/nickel transport system ATP-binding protein